MKILMLSTDFPYKSKAGTITQGGGGACIAQLVGALLDKKLDIMVVTRAEKDIKAEIYRTNIVRSGYLYLGFRESKITHSLFLLPKAIQAIRRYGPEIIHSHNPPAAIVGIICAKIFRRPHVVTMHGPWSGVRLNSIMRFIAGIIEGLAVKNADVVTCDSKALNEELAGKYKLKNSVPIQNAVEVGEFAEVKKAEAREGIQVKTGDKIVLFTGRFVAEKGLEYLLEAAIRTLGKYKNVTFLLIGGGFDEAIVKNWLERNPGYKEKILVIPYLRHELMNLAYRASDIFVLPSLAEGLSRSVMEAMVCGLPIIATNVGGNPELIDNATGILVEPKNSQALADAIETLLNDERLSESLGKNAREFAMKNLTIEKRVEKFINVYKKLV